MSISNIFIFEFLQPIIAMNESSSPKLITNFKTCHIWQLGHNFVLLLIYIGFSFPGVKYLSIGLICLDFHTQVQDKAALHIQYKVASVSTIQYLYVVKLREKHGIPEEVLLYTSA